MPATQADRGSHGAQPMGNGSTDYDGDYDGDDDDGDSIESDGQERRRQIRRKQLVRLVALVCATLTSLSAGSLSAFSLFAPKLQSRLHYTQLQVNGVAIGSALALYLPVSPMGYVCDRIGPSPLSLLSSILFGAGYGLAAFIYRTVDTDMQHKILHQEKPLSPHEWSYSLMVLAFAFVGSGTCSVYIAAVSTCAKNFGKGRYRGLALAMPITAFGLSGMWLSQFGSRFLAETLPDGSRGDVDVYRYFVFLASLSAIAGVLGFFTLRVVDEQDLIDEAIEELETSGLLDGSMLLGRASSYTSHHTAPPIASDTDPLLTSSKDDDAQWKKNWVLNAETRRFLLDRTMWPFAISFLLLIGPGEAYVNNLGTILGTLTPPSEELGGKTSAATHVSIFAIASTIARLSMGSLTDLLAPSPETQHLQISTSNRSFRSHHSTPQSRFTISRVVFMLVFGLAMSIGLIFLASGATQNHPERFWIVTSLVGAGYGATFSLAPLLITIIWGVENFATNFGLVAMLPALGSTFWGLVYSAVYQAGAHRAGPADGGGGSGDELFCYGEKCYSAAYWAEGISVLLACLLLLWAWKGTDGWQRRGIVV
ncbi:hypothetical protein CDD81_331 [Ophiocordyceps australis]|uniref:Probable transporter MCH1 n=1 Tax=Ophiocordyceps australis TaxID=1399860 RepID=A0A2C5Y3F0_9HYPO|nr:hypothetical protein CDD81_331 [Ophiocordyceps australis]